MKVVRKDESYICINNTFYSTTIILSIFRINIVLQHEQDWIQSTSQICMQVTKCVCHNYNVIWVQTANNCSFQFIEQALISSQAQLQPSLKLMAQNRWETTKVPTVLQLLTNTCSPDTFHSDLKRLAMCPFFKVLLLGDRLQKKCFISTGW